MTLPKQASQSTDSGGTNIILIVLIIKVWFTKVSVKYFFKKYPLTSYNVQLQFLPFLLEELLHKEYTKMHTLDKYSKAIGNEA